MWSFTTSIANRDHRHASTVPHTPSTNCSPSTHLLRPFSHQQLAPCSSMASADHVSSRRTSSTCAHTGASDGDSRTLSRAEQPSIVTNPIYVRPVLETAPPAEAPRPTGETPLPADHRTAVWTIEAAADAEATVTAPPDAINGVQFAFRLGATPGSFAAMQLPTPANLATFDRLVMHASADRPMRVWVQLRVPGGEGQRWGRSVYLDATPREVVVLFDGMLPFGRVGSGAPAAGGHHRASRRRRYRPRAAGRRRAGDHRPAAARAMTGHLPHVRTVRRR